MAIGDQTDCLSRIKALLPRGWFGDTTPVLDALLSGPAWALAFIYSLLQYAELQTRIATATDGFLDLISYDFFGNSLPRRAQELDNPFRARIFANLFNEKVTRNGMIKALVALTGRTPIIFAPANLADAGAWDITLAYDVGLPFGDTNLPAQVFITAFRPSGAGIPNVAGFDTNAGCWDSNYTELTDESQVQGYVKDSDIFATIAATKAEGVIAWAQIQS